MRIDTARGSFAALCAGPRTSARPTVVCVHGFMGCKQDFAELLPLVGAGYRVVAFDQRGHFETAQMQATEAEQDVRLPELAEDVLAVIDALGCERVHLVGHSFGGFVVRAAALAEARRITTLTLIGSGQGAVGEPHAEELRLLVWALREYPLDQVWEAMKAYRARQRSGQRRLVDPERESFLRRQFIAHSPHALMEAARALQEEPNRLDELRRLDRPVLVLYGEDEKYWPASAQRHMAQCLRARLVEIPHAGHCPPIDDPCRTAVELRAFFTAVDGLAQPAPPAAEAVPGPPL
ncbi:alpha/beta fold hydrolase [Geodermatophilus sp. SYSU D00779]